jgi:uncharacterized membrane protein
MANNPTNAVVAVYDSHERAENAIRKLVDSKIPMEKLSVIGKGYHTEEKLVGFYNTGDRVKFWGKFGAFWGGLWGLLAGGLYMTVPLIGPVVVLGHFAAMVLAAIEGAVVTGGLSALGAALFSIGIPKNTVLQYEQAVKADGFLVLVQGTAEEAERARALLNATAPKQIDMHCCKSKRADECDAPKVKAVG